MLMLMPRLWWEDSWHASVVVVTVCSSQNAFMWDGTYVNMREGVCMLCVIEQLTKGWRHVSLDPGTEERGE